MKTEGLAFSYTLPEIMTTPQWCSHCPFFLRAAPISFGIDAIIRSIISGGKPWSVLVHDYWTVYRSLFRSSSWWHLSLEICQQNEICSGGFRSGERRGFINITRITSRSRSLVCTFKQISITLVKVFSSQDTLFSAYWYPYAHMQDTSGNCLKLLHSFRQPPEYLSMKTCQQIFLNFAMFQWPVDNHKQLFFLVVPNFYDGCCLN